LTSLPGKPNLLRQDSQQFVKGSAARKGATLATAASAGEHARKSFNVV